MRSLCKLLLLLFVLCSASSCLSRPRQPPRNDPKPAYHLLILPLAEVSAINDQGQVVGIRYPRIPYKDTDDMYSEAYQSYVWANGSLHSLGSASTHPRVLAAAINNKGDIVGSENDVTGGPFPFTLGDAYLWRHGHKSKLRPLVLHLGEADATFASAINNSGIIVGSSGMASVMRPDDSEDWSHAVVWEHDKLTDLGWGEAKAVNDQGQIAGVSTSFPDQFEDHATIWDHGRKTTLGVGTANAINNKSQVIGSLYDGRAFLHDHGRIVDLGECAPVAINDQGQVLLDGNWSDDHHAVYLWQRGKRYDINCFVPEFTRWSRLIVSGINNKGVIIGYGTFQGQERAFLLTPKSTRKRINSLARPVAQDDGSEGPAP